MQVSEARLFPVCYFAETIVYAMDVWPPRYDQWEAFFRRHRMRVAFISARMSAERMRAARAGARRDLAAGGDRPGAVRGRQTARRALDRRPGDGPAARRRTTSGSSATAQPAVTTTATKQSAARSSSRRTTSSSPPWATARSRVCFPSSMTHPQRTGDVETHDAALPRIDRRPGASSSATAPRSCATSSGTTR